MKRVVLIVIGLLTAFGTFFAMGQGRSGDEKMAQDIEVAENILSTLFRQQLGKKMFFPMEIHGSYTSGYGVTFRMPQNSAAISMFKIGAGGEDINMMISPSDMVAPKVAYSYSFRSEESSEDDESATEALKRASAAEQKAMEEQRRASALDKRAKEAERRDSGTRPRRSSMSIGRDSVRTLADKMFLETAKIFLADYGDVLSQLKPDERIVITNRSEGFDYGFIWGGEARRSLISVEVRRDDIAQFRQGKITRDQFLGKLKIVNAESTDKLDPDLEVFASMFSRLYREDLSKTYYTEGDVNYERMKDFGVIYYMRVFSSVEDDEKGYYLPTIAQGSLNQADRDKKVKELYPAFEASIKDNLVEYGRTVHSLKDEEQIVLNVRLTKCTACGIPHSVEVSAKAATLKDYAAGKITKQEALGKVNVKKVGVQ